MVNKVLICSPIRQKPNILEKFLNSLLNLNKDDLELHYFFVDDNQDQESISLLNNFKSNKNVIVKYPDDYDIKVKSNYNCNNHTHEWKRELIEKIIIFKNDMIEYSRKNNFDYLFFIDSDIVLHKETLKHLISRNVDIVSNVFWTRWKPWSELFPQVWKQDENLLYVKEWYSNYTKSEIIQYEKNFIENLKIPGIYEVGGLGACTLISKNAIKKGVSFSIINNLSFWGEDRHFCIRAASLDLKLYVDTVYPAYHIYREDYLDGVDKFNKSGFSFDLIKKYPRKKILKALFFELRNRFKNKLTFTLKSFKQFIKRKLVFKGKKEDRNNDKIVLSMIVHNEENRYLEKMLNHAKQFVDEILIIDDASTDNTVKMCTEILKDKPHKIIVNEKSMFSNEYKLRKKQWNEVKKLNPGWILCLDADEIFEDEIIEKIRYMVQNKNVDAYAFRLYDMWDETSYREDEYWNSHKRYVKFLIRYCKSFRPRFRKTKQHCGRFPKNIWRLNYVCSDIRLKHYGWADKVSREQKYKRYLSLDSKFKYGIKEQYESILDENPNLINFK